MQEQYTISGYDAQEQSALTPYTIDSKSYPQEDVDNSGTNPPTNYPTNPPNQLPDQFPSLYTSISPTLSLDSPRGRPKNKSFEQAEGDVNKRNKLFVMLPLTLFRVIEQVTQSATDRLTYLREYAVYQSALYEWEKQLQSFLLLYNISNEDEAINVLNQTSKEQLHKLYKDRKIPHRFTSIEQALFWVLNMCEAKADFSRIKDLYTFINDKCTIYPKTFIPLRIMFWDITFDELTVLGALESCLTKKSEPMIVYRNQIIARSIGCNKHDDIPDGIVVISDNQLRRRLDRLEKLKLVYRYFTRKSKQGPSTYYGVSWQYQGEKEFYDRIASIVYAEQQRDTGEVNWDQYVKNKIGLMNGEEKEAKKELPADIPSSDTRDFVCIGDALYYPAQAYVESFGETIARNLLENAKAIEKNGVIYYSSQEKRNR